MLFRSGIVSDYFWFWRGVCGILRQLSCRVRYSLFVLFCIVSFSMLMFLRVQIGMTLFRYVAYVFRFFDLLSLKLVSLE